MVLKNNRQNFDKKIKHGNYRKKVREKHGSLKDKPMKDNSI